jgi:transcriptional regulator with XRE-family HTH domain
MPVLPHELLRELRRRRQAILPESRFIGEFTRSSHHVGRRVTQEELAEALGISREWYSALENGRFGKASPGLVRKIGRALYSPREAQRLKWNPNDLECLPEIRRFVKRVTAASSYFDAAVEAVATGNRLLAATCVGVINLESDGDIRGHAIGPRAHFWKPLCDRVVHDAHRSLRDGGVGVSENIPTADEALTNPSVMLSFESPMECHDAYDYECASDLWRDFNGDLEVRSVIAAPMHDRYEYRGTLAFSWSEPRSIALREIEVVRNLTAVLALVS